jgi:hypothetical protein
MNQLVAATHRSICEQVSVSEGWWVTHGTTFLRLAFNVNKHNIKEKWIKKETAELMRPTLLLIFE